MKKIFTLATFVLLTMAVFAADHRPSVTLMGGRHYEVVIDGRVVSGNQYGGNQYGGNQYGAIQINNLRNGRHTITVYEIPRRFFASRNKRVISSSVFMLRGNDVAIRIDQSGQVRIKESRMDRGYDNRDWNDRDQRNNGYDKGYGQGNDSGWDDQDDRNRNPQDTRGTRDRNDRNQPIDRNGQNGHF
ncbi:MAG: hypothetical protein ABIR30_11430 [Chitinophagaceae bacterium]